MRESFRLIVAGFFLGVGFYLATSLMNTVALLVQRYFLLRAAGRITARVVSPTKPGPSLTPMKFYRPADRNVN